MRTHPGHQPASPFASGPWRGFWEQGLIRGWMTLDLRFDRGLVRGHGRDCVGDFVLRGRYDETNGTLDMHKQFIGLHAVHYQGALEGPVLRGAWRMKNALGALSGPFRLWPLAHDEAERRAMLEVKPEVVIAKGKGAGALVG